MKKTLKNPYSRAVIAAVVLLIVVIFVSGYIYDAIRYKSPFYIAYHQYPGANATYIKYSPSMEGAEPSDFDGLEFIGWYYLDENGNERQFIPSEFTPPESPENNCLDVYGRWKSVPPDTVE